MAKNEYAKCKAITFEKRKKKFYHKYEEIENERKIEWNSFLNDIHSHTHTQVLLLLLFLLK